MQTRSVHGRGLRTGVDYLALDDAGHVLRAGRLGAGGIVWCRRARWIVELPRGIDLPVPGTVLRLDRLTT